MKKKILIYIVAIATLSACKKDFLETEPTENATTKDLKVEPLISGLYTFTYQFNTQDAASEPHDDFGQKSIDLGLDLMGEDMVQTEDHWFGYDYLLDNRAATFRRPYLIWNFYYKLIYSANLVADKIPENATDQKQRHSLGQALAFRGNSYFYLIQLFQQTYKGNENKPGVPLYTSAENIQSRPRASVQAVYDQILSDLLDAYNLLEGFNRPSKAQIDRSVVAGYLSRVYLVMENFPEAARFAKLAQAGYTLMSREQYKEGFADLNNPEWMFGAAVTSLTQTSYASFFSHVSSVDPGYAGALGIYKAIDNRLYEALSPSDVRREVFNDPDNPTDPDLPSYVNLKFIDAQGNWTSDYVYMRAAEMYYNEAEALCRNLQYDEAADVLFAVVSKRDPSYTRSSSTGTTLLEEIWVQKRLDLWGEGFEFLDRLRLKRGINRTTSENHRSDAKLVFNAGSADLIYQIPQREIDANDNKLEQNP